MTKIFPSYDQNQLKIISDLVCDDIEHLLQILGITDYKFLDKMVVMNCPIHGGDNPSAFNLYHKGESYRGNWKCRSHQCENIFKSSIIGFIRGCISRSKYNWSCHGDTMASFNEAVDFAVKFTNKDINELKLSKKQIEKNNFVNTVKYISKLEKQNTKTINRQTVIKSLKIPSSYFLSRNYSPEILIKYDIGECITDGKEMSNRAVAPIYDEHHINMIGCTGRSINNEKPKWKHSAGFDAESCLYNYWFSKSYIKDTATVILVESPGNVWRLEEAGIHNSVAIFGSSLKPKQKMLLDISGAMKIITIMDNDEAGRKASLQIKKLCEKTYICNDIELNYSDIGEMTINEINNEIKPLIERYMK